VQGLFAVTRTHEQLAAPAQGAPPRRRIEVSVDALFG